MIDIEILQDILTDHKLCNTQAEELKKSIRLLKKSDDIDKAFLDMCKEVNHYRELKEQGRLIELPCKIVDTVYVLAECQSIQKKLDGTLYDSDGGFGTATGYYCQYEDCCPNEDIDNCCEICKGKTAIFEDTISGFMIDNNEINLFTENCGVSGNLGEYIFLAKAEAEKVLAERQASE